MATIQGKMIGQVYTGRSGCACGCRGKYSNKAGAITKVVNRMKQYPFVPEGNQNDLDKLLEIDGCSFTVEYETPSGTRRVLPAYYDRND